MPSGLWLGKTISGGRHDFYPWPVEQLPHRPRCGMRELKERNRLLGQENEILRPAGAYPVMDINKII